MPAKNVIVPPRVADNAPIHGPRRKPIIGAVIAAAVMLLLGMPSIRKIGMDPRTAYKAVKHAISATSFAVKFLSGDKYQPLLFERGDLII